MSAIDADTPVVVRRSYDRTLGAGALDRAGEAHLHGEEFGLLTLRGLQNGIHPLPCVRVRLQLLQYALRS